MTNATKKNPESYHHGNLHADALDIGIHLLNVHQVEDLSLRAVARELGVSANALYRHFENKTVFLEALSRAGAAKLAEAQVRAANASKEDGNELAAMGKAYVEFAIAHPALFRLIFRNAPPVDYLEGEIDQVPLMARQFREKVSTQMAEHTSDSTEISDQARRLWALVHGLASLILDGQIEYDAEMLERMFPLQWWEFSQKR